MIATPPTAGGRGEQIGRVEVGATIRGAAASIPRLPFPVINVVLALTFVEYLLPGGVVAIVASLLEAGATALVVAALLGSGTSGLRSLVELSVRRLPSVVGVRLVQAAVAAVFGAVSGVAVLLLLTGARPPAASDAALLYIFIVAIGLTLPFFARWICALPFVIDRSNGPTAALKASWRATRGSWIACLALVVPTTLAQLLPALFGGPLRLPVGVLITATTTIIAAAVMVAAYRQVVANAAMEPNRLRDASTPNLDRAGLAASQAAAQDAVPARTSTADLPGLVIPGTRHESSLAARRDDSQRLAPDAEPADADAPSYWERTASGPRYQRVLVVLGALMIVLGFLGTILPEDPRERRRFRPRTSLRVARSRGGRAVRRPRGIGFCQRETSQLHRRARLAR